MKSHENIPLLLVPYCRNTGCHLIICDHFLKRGQSCIGRIYMFSKGQTVPSVFVAIEDQGLVWQGCEVFKCREHFGTGAFEKATTASDKQCVTSEDGARMIWRRRISDIKAYRVLGMARSGETSRRWIR